VFPEEVKSDVTVLEKAIARCSVDQITKLFEKFPEKVKSDVTVYEKARLVSYSRFGFLCSCFIGLGGSDAWHEKKSVCEKAIDRCEDTTQILDLFKMFPEEVKKQEEICTACLEKVPLDSLESMWSQIPDELKTSGRAFEVMSRRGGTGTVGQKHFSLLSILPQLLLVTAFVGGFIEIIMYGFGKFLGEETLETHWRRAPDQSWVFAPMPDCLLPPPPSAWISAFMDIGKAGAFTLMFGYIKRDLHSNQDKPADYWKKRVVFVMISLFQLIIVPMSSAFTIYHFITEVYPKQPDFSAGYQCFFIGWNSSFLDFSYWLLLVRVVGTYEVLSLSGLEEKHRVSMKLWYNVTFLNPKEQLKELHAALLSDDDAVEFMGTSKPYPHTAIGALEVSKCHVTTNALCITAGIYVLIDLPFILTHKLPASMIFLPFLLVMAVAIVIIFRFTWPLGFKVLWNQSDGKDAEGIRRSWDSEETLVASTVVLEDFFLTSAIFRAPISEESKGWAEAGYAKYAKELADKNAKQYDQKFQEEYPPLACRGCLGTVRKRFTGLLQWMRKFDKFDKLNKLDWDTAERTGYLVFLPILIGMSFMNLILTYGSVYLYSNTGYFTSVELVFAERHADRYLKALLTKILPTWWSGTAFIGAIF
jgi:hypothetical protein